MKLSSPIELYMQPMRQLNISMRKLDDPVPLHMHNFYEIELVIDGTGSNWINGVSFPLSHGMLYILTPSDTHRIDFTGALYLLHVGFLPDTDSDFSMPLPSGSYVDYLSDSELDPILHYFSIMEKEYNSHAPYHLQSTYAALSLILIHLLRHGHQCTALSSFQKLQPALTYIWEHCSDQTLNLNTVAEACYLSTSYFSSIFRQTFGVSFSAYLAECRLRCACYLLSETDMSISDIVYKCGFSSPSRFFRVFKSRFHCTPGDYRQDNARAAIQTGKEYVPASLWCHGERPVSTKIDTEDSYPTSKDVLSESAVQSAHTPPLPIQSSSPEHSS